MRRVDLDVHLIRPLLKITIQLYSGNFTSLTTWGYGIFRDLKVAKLENQMYYFVGQLKKLYKHVTIENRCLDVMPF